MDSLGLVKPQCLGYAVNDALRDAGGVAALQPGVVLAGDAREESYLPAQPGDPPTVSAVRGQSSLLGVTLARRVPRNSLISARKST